MVSVLGLDGRYEGPRFRRAGTRVLGLYVRGDGPSFSACREGPSYMRTG